MNQYLETLGDSRSDHSYDMEVRRIKDGTWTRILVHADSRLKAAKLAAEAGYNGAGGDTQQTR